MSMDRPPSEVDALAVEVTAAGGAPGQAGVRESARGRGGGAPDALVDAVHRLEGSATLDRAGVVLATMADAVVRSDRARDLLTGAWLGHALHPLLTDFPLGLWSSASLLDLIGGRSARPAARRLVGLGVVAALPTAASGLAEWRQADTPSRRVGTVHAATNSVALTLYTASYVVRRRGRHARAVALGVAGGLVATAGGYLGGHLSLARKVGTRDPAFARAATADGGTEAGSAGISRPADQA
jgi:uncharacterized membrane protein